MQDKILKKIPEVAQVFGKAGTGGDGHRPGAAGDVRDGHQSEAGRSVAHRA